VLKKFTDETGIKVDLEVIGWNDLQTRIQTAITSGQGPDVLNIGNTWAASLQATDAFLPFDSNAMNAIGGKDRFVPTALATGGKPTFTGDGNVQGVLRYLDLMQKDKVANTSNAQYDNGTNAVNDFATKKVAMVLNQNNADSSIVANGMKISEYGVTAFPAP